MPTSNDKTNLLNKLATGRPHFVGNKPIEKRGAFMRVLDYMKNNAGRLLLTGAVSIGVATVAGWAIIKHLGEKIAEKAADKIIDVTFDSTEKSSKKLASEFTNMIKEIADSSGEKELNLNKLDEILELEAQRKTIPSRVGEKVTSPVFHGTHEQFIAMAPLMMTLTEHYREGKIERNFANMKELAEYVNSHGKGNVDMNIEVSFGGEHSTTNCIVDQAKSLDDDSVNSWSNRNKNKNSGPKFTV